PLVRNRRAAAPEVEQGSGLLLEPVDSARDRLLTRTHDRVLGKLALARDLVRELFHQARERIQQAKTATRTLQPGRRALVLTLAHTKVRTTTHVEMRVVVVAGIAPNAPQAECACNTRPNDLVKCGHFRAALSARAVVDVNRSSLVVVRPFRVDRVHAAKRGVLAHPEAPLAEPLAERNQTALGVARQ